MSQDNVEIVQRSFIAFARRDTALFFELHRRT
jgi:hypothetical protein